MSDEVKVLYADFDTLQVERVFIAERDGRPELHALISGVECFVDAKPTLLEDGLVFCQPIDPAEVENWPAYCDLVVNGAQTRHWCIVQVPRLAEAARKFAELRDAGQAIPGMEL